MWIMIEFLVGALLVAVIMTVEALAMPVIVIAAFVGCWTIGRYAIRFAMNSWVWWINDQIERGKL